MISKMETQEEIIRELHSGDSDQLEFIVSQNGRIVVEAPAGYGKTKTMISKIAYQIATKLIPNPKKILALTFSINAAYKIRKDVTEQIPNILYDQGASDINIAKRIVVSNYHGLCRSILSKYGFRISDHLRKIESLISIDDSKNASFEEHDIQIDQESKDVFVNFNFALKEANSTYLKANFGRYIDAVINKLLPLGYIPFNAVLCLTISLLKQYPNIKTFYQKLFPCIYVDEFQDTNILSYGLIKQLVGDSTRLYLMGDSLQRIYGFIGAIPDLITKAQAEFNMSFISLKHNHRFNNNSDMLLLDFNVRRNAESLTSPNIREAAKIDLKVFPNQDMEAKYILNKCKSLLDSTELEKVSVLFRGGQNNANTLKVIEEFNQQGIAYFYGLFGEDDIPYRKFHFDASYEFSTLLNGRNFSKKTSRQFISKIKNKYNGKSPMFDSLVSLCEIFFRRLFTDYYHLSEDEKIILVKETFEGYGLKQYMEYSKHRVIITTIHGAKGLEWEYVIVPDMEQSSLPNYFSCKECKFSGDCNIIFDKENEAHYLDELSVFYVAFTRAKKQVFFSASKQSLTKKGSWNRNLSCFLRLPGIEISSQ